jgi:hypothetical protein
VARRSHHTVRLERGSHRSQSVGACAMELASMLAHEPFSDRPRSVSPVIGAFVRTYNDGVDDDRRQDLYPVASEIVGTAAGRVLASERVSLRLEFATRRGFRPPRGRAAMAAATPEAAGTLAARAALARGEHQEALALVRRLVGRRTAPRAPVEPPPERTVAT